MFQALTSYLLTPERSDSLATTSHEFRCLSYRCSELTSFVGRTERQRVPAVHRPLNKPELAPLGPAYMRRSIADRALTPARKSSRPVVWFLYASEGEVASRLPSSVHRRSVDSRPALSMRGFPRFAEAELPIRKLRHLNSAKKQTPIQTRAGGHTPGRSWSEREIVAHWVS